MNPYFALALFLAGLLLALAGWSFVSGRQARVREKVERHFAGIIPGEAQAAVTAPRPGEARWWQRARTRLGGALGYQFRRRDLVLWPAALAAAAVLGGTWQGVAGAALVPAGILAAAVLVLRMRLARQRAHLVAQLPVFLDLMLRALATGRDVHSALRLATEESQDPLRELMMRVRRESELGVDLGEALRNVAESRKIPEIGLVAMGLKISYHFGTSPKEMLASVITMIRQQERARGELAAMTGETRISAWVLGLLPVGVATYIALTNPGYMAAMLDDPTGRLTFAVAAGLQVLGVLILWRMMRSV
ncbi:type II secretion system F family protein [Pseudothauera rhizosphaerae]|uniref:Type II secretion system protein GspF domain-containing protein n=1 Tax=Pseudothauera rhizosphaerae TaxID=2565932 RepID=A0A4S4AW67_9RHOO|nr:type II secretion system F family protein [Pseudothauera rhizosphaerae]THF64272.1 hypothetical protein E6O51_02855 [Pseudothauera rhizosphaerae]